MLSPATTVSDSALLLERSERGLAPRSLPPFLVAGAETTVQRFVHRGEPKIWYTPGTGDVVRMLMRCRFGRGWLAQAVRLPLGSFSRREPVAWRASIALWLRSIGLAPTARFVAQRGSAGLYRKYVALGLGRDGATAWVLKRSDTVESRASMAAEAEALPRIAALLDERNRVPRLYGATGDSGAYLTVQQACIPTDAAIERTWTSAHHRFCRQLGAAARVQPCRLWSDAILRRERVRELLTAQWPSAGAVSHVCAELLAFAAGAVDFDRVPLGWAHRDFTPWNAFTRGDTLTVVDWEWADPAWTPLHDCWHFHWFQRLLANELGPRDWAAAESAAGALAGELSLPGRLAGYAALYLYDTLLFYADAVRRGGRDPAADALVVRVADASQQLLERWREEGA